MPKNSDISVILAPTSYQINHTTNSKNHLQRCLFGHLRRPQMPRLTNYGKKCEQNPFEITRVEMSMLSFDYF